MKTIIGYLRPLALASGGLLLSASAVVLAAQQPSINVHGDDITIRGCVGRGSADNFGTERTLVWSRSDIMLRNVIDAGSSTAFPDKVFYWLNDDEDLAKHVGKMVEVKGDLGDFKRGEVEMKRDGQFTNITLKLGDKTEKARVPSSWLGAQGGEGSFDFPTRRVDVDSVKVLGNCPAV